MPSGNLTVNITDLLSRALERKVEIQVRRDPGPLGAGGGDVDFNFDPGGATAAHLVGIPNRGGPGSLHVLRLFVRGYRMFSFQQFITEGEQAALQDVFMVRSPNHVASIEAPAFRDLPKKLRDWLGSAEMIAPRKEDRDLLNKKGEALYDALGDERKAAVLNIFRKATHASTVGSIFDFVQSPLVFRRDRCFARVDAAIIGHVAADSRFVPVSNLLHDPLPGYHLSNSVKSDDPHANIQLTFQQKASDGSFGADIDIDEHSGFGHWGEVLRNFFQNQRTNPYAIHELLLAADLAEHTLDPGYELILKA
jgi:hypothetical protein